MVALPTTHCIITSMLLLGKAYSMRKYGIFSAILFSFFSPSLYRDVANNWGAWSLFYTLVLTLLLTMVISVSEQERLKAYKNMVITFSEHWKSETPKIKIRRGNVITPENKPYLLHKSNDSSIWGIIDTSGQYRVLDDKSTARVLLTKNQFFYRDDRNMIQVYNFPKTSNFTIDPNGVIKLVKDLFGYSWLTLIPVVWMFVFIAELIRAALYAILGKAITLFFNINLRYGTVFSLLLVCLTPLLIIKTIFSAALLPFPYPDEEGFVCYAIIFIYLIFAIVVNKDMKTINKSNHTIVPPANH